MTVAQASRGASWLVTLSWGRRFGEGRKTAGSCVIGPGLQERAGGRVLIPEAGEPSTAPLPGSDRSLSPSKSPAKHVADPGPRSPA